MWRHHKDFAETRECGHPALVLKGGGWVRFFCSRMPHRTGEHFYDQTRDILNVDPRPSTPRERCTGSDAHLAETRAS